MNRQNYISNRLSIARELNQGVIVISAYSAMQQTNDSAGPFVQESNFLWLTGINEPDWLLFIDIENMHSCLVAPERDEVSLIFDGGLTLDQSKEISGVDEVIDRNQLDQYLQKLNLKNREVWTLFSEQQRHTSYIQNPSSRKTIQMLKKMTSDLTDVSPFIAKLRAIKQPCEIELIEDAVKMTLKSFKRIESQLNEFKMENEIMAEFSYDFERQNASHAYQPIVGSGINACTLHYSQNNQPLKKNNFVLIDIGAKLDNYSADITRTWFYGSEMSARQQDLKHIVEKSAQDVISLIKPGVSFKEYSEESDEIMKKAVKALGFDKDADYRKYFPHAISHGLGLDVHDSLGGHGEFKPGMILTVEPGIYIPEEQIGFRYEDDVLVTDSSQRVLGF